MEQKDYLLREIEKIGLVLKMIFNKIVGKDVNDSITLENQFEQSKELLLKETGFDTELFLTLEKTEAEAYISTFSGLNCSNIELMADVFRETGMRAAPAKQKQYLESALYLYSLCNRMDKTYSMERENKISEIKNAL
jgi:hypothetical protein